MFSTCFRYYSATSDVLMSVKKVEDSLKRLKKNRGTDKSAGSQGMTDDDKIRQQFIVDIENFEAQVALKFTENISIHIECY